METRYINLPIGKVSEKRIKPWFLWCKERECEFKSFPELIRYFREVTDTEEEKVESYLETGFIDMIEILKKEIIFCINIILFDTGEDTVRLLVRFYSDDTVEYDEVYYDDSYKGTSLEKNIKQIDAVLQERQDTKRLSWREFRELIEEVESGKYSKELNIPEF